jgi:hypothetical protein
MLIRNPFNSWLSISGLLQRSQDSTHFDEAWLAWLCGGREAFLGFSAGVSTGAVLDTTCNVTLGLLKKDLTSILKGLPRKFENASQARQTCQQPSKVVEQEKASSIHRN